MKLLVAVGCPIVIAAIAAATSHDDYGIYNGGMRM